MKRILLTILVFVLFVNIQRSYAETMVISSAEEFTAALDNKDITNIVLSPGEYLGNFTTNREGLTLSAEEPGTVILKPLEKDKPVFKASCLTWSKNLALINLVFESEDASALSNAIQIEWYDNVTMQGLLFLNFTFPITLGFIDGITIDNCVFQEFIVGIGAGSLSGNSIVKNCSFVSKNEANQRISGLTISDSTANGVLNINDNSFDTTFAVIVEKNAPSYMIVLGDNVYDTLTPFIYQSDTTNTVRLSVLISDLHKEISGHITEDEWLFIRSTPNADKPEPEFVAELRTAFEANDYVTRTTLLKRYLKSMFSNTENLIPRTDYIIMAIKCLAISPKWDENISETSDKRTDLLGKQLYNWPGLKYFLPACQLAEEGQAPDVFKMLGQNLTIGGIQARQLVGELPKTRIESFRTNFNLYEEYRNNSSAANSYAQRLKELLSSSKEAPMETVKASHALITSLQNIRAMGDKEARILYYDLPLWIIMLQVVAAIEEADGDKDKLETVGANFASYGVIKSDGIVGTSTSLAFNGLTNRFESEFGFWGKRRFNKFKTALETTPPWWKDTGGALIEQTKIR